MYVCHQNWESELTNGAKPSSRILSERKDRKRLQLRLKHKYEKSLKNHESLSMICHLAFLEYNILKGRNNILYTVLNLLWT